MSPVRRTRRSALLALGVISTLAISPLNPFQPIAEAGPCSTMFGNFGSLLEQNTGAGMGTGSLRPESLASSTALDRSHPAIHQLETGSLGNGLSGSIGSISGSVYGMPPWTSGEQGTVPVLRGPTQFVQLVTGPTSPTNSVEKFGVNGTDLGIMWDNGNQSDPTVLMAFGDTMGDCTTPDNQWRSNVLFRTPDRDLTDGLSINSAATDSGGKAKSIIPRSNLPGEVTIIPTAGIAVNGVQFLRFMSIQRWGQPGSWTTNYSGLAYSVDNGENWTVVPRMSRPITSSVPLGEGAQEPDEKWAPAQMSSFLLAEGYLYEYLAAAGRQGTPILARVALQGTPNSTELAGTPSAPRPGGMLDPEGYQYWTGSTWARDITESTAVMPAPASEQSVMWNAYLNKYVTMYSTGLSPVILRTADRPEGPWSSPTVLINYATMPGTYGGFIHPWAQGKDLYYVVTTWNSYNVFLVKTDLSKISVRGLRPAAQADQPWDPTTVLIPQSGPTEADVIRRIQIDDLVDGKIPTQ